MIVQVFEDVVDILDPEMNLGSDDEDDDDYNDVQSSEVPSTPMAPARDKTDNKKDADET